MPCETTCTLTTNTLERSIREIMMESRSFPKFRDVLQAFLLCTCRSLCFSLCVRDLLTKLGCHRDFVPSDVFGTLLGQLRPQPQENICGAECAVPCAARTLATGPLVCVSCAGMCSITLACSTGCKTRRIARVPCAARHLTPLHLPRPCTPMWLCWDNEPGGDVHVHKMKISQKASHPVLFCSSRESNHGSLPVHRSRSNR